MKKVLFAFVSFVLASFFCFGGISFAANDRLETRMDECAMIMDEIMMMPEQSIPEDLLNKCEGIGIFPSTISGAFIFGGRFGQGVVVARDPKTRKWGAPAFFTIGGASWGLQIGGQATDLIFVITTRRGVSGLLQDQFTLGGDASVAAGPVGRKAEASTDVLMKAGIFSYSRNKGLFAGIALQGAIVAPNKGDNKALYGEGVTTDAIFQGKAKPTPEAKKLIDTLNKYAQ